MSKISDKFSAETPFFTVVCTEKHNRLAFYSDSEETAYFQATIFAEDEGIIFLETIDARI